jgi:hypothetical protein
VRKRRCDVCMTWSSEDGAVQDEITNKFKCDDGATEKTLSRITSKQGLGGGGGEGRGRGAEGIMS